MCTDEADRDSDWGAESRWEGRLSPLAMAHKTEKLGVVPFIKKAANAAIITPLAASVDSVTSEEVTRRWNAFHKYFDCCSRWDCDDTLALLRPAFLVCLLSLRALDTEALGDWLRLIDALLVAGVALRLLTGVEGLEIAPSEAPPMSTDKDPPGEFDRDLSEATDMSKAAALIPLGVAASSWWGGVEGAPPKGIRELGIEYHLFPLTTPPSPTTVGCALITPDLASELGTIDPRGPLLGAPFAHHGRADSTDGSAATYEGRLSWAMRFAAFFLAVRTRRCRSKLPMDSRLSANARSLT